LKKIKKENERKITDMDGLETISNVALAQAD
jgi:hypothetical protein